MIDEDIESYWDVIRPPRAVSDPLEVTLSEGEVSPTTMEEQFRRAQELALYPASRVRVLQTVRSESSSHLTVRPMIMSQATYDDFMAMHPPPDVNLDGVMTLADGILHNRNPESFHNIEDELPLRDLQLALQTLGYDCLTWVSEEGRLCIQFHGLAEDSWASPCVSGELRLNLRSPHA